MFNEQKMSLFVNFKFLKLRNRKLTRSRQKVFLRTSIAKAIAIGTIEEGQKFGYISTFEFKFSGNLETLIF